MHKYKKHRTVSQNVNVIYKAMQKLTGRRVR